LCGYYCNVCCVWGWQEKWDSLYGFDVDEMDGWKVINKVLWRLVDGGISLCLIAFEVTQNMCFTLVFVFWKCFCKVIGTERFVYEALGVKCWFLALGGGFYDTNGAKRMLSTMLSVLSIFLGLSVITHSEVMIHVWYNCWDILWWLYVTKWYIQMMNGGMFNHMRRCYMFVYTYVMGYYEFFDNRKAMMVFNQRALLSRIKGFLSTIRLWH